MSETDELARAITQAITDAIAAVPVRVAVGKITEYRTGFMAVTLPAGRTECETTGSVDADAFAHQPVSPRGDEAIVQFVAGRAVVTGIIWTGA